MTRFCIILRRQDWGLEIFVSLFLDSCIFTVVTQYPKDSITVL